MKRNAMKRWVGACLLGSAVATGCSQTGSRVEDRPPWAAQPYVPSKAVVQGKVETRPTQLPMSLPAPAVVQRKVEEPRAEAPTTLPAPDTLSAAAPEKKDTDRDSSILRTALDNRGPSPVTEPTAVRRAFVDITAQPGFSHAEDYGSLCGQLQRTHKGWRLRYASVDEVDPYGGSVTLSDESRLSEFKDGDLVRVHGRLLNPEDNRIAPPYELISIQAVQKRD